MKKIVPSFFYIAFLSSVFIFYSCKDNASELNKSGKSTLKDTTINDLSYGNHDRNKLDLYLSKGRDSTTPLVVFIHGGAWKAGRKEEFNSYVNKFRRFWPDASVANMNYRLASSSDNIHHPEIMNDIQACLDFLLEERIKYSYGQDFYLVGASAGAHLAMIYAYNENAKHNIKAVGNIFGPSRLNDWAWYSSFNIILNERISDVLTNYIGVSWDSAIYANVSPISHVDSSTTPTITFHGNLDPIVPIYQSQQLRNRLNQYGIKNEYHEYIAFHSFDNTQSDDVLKKMVAFFKDVK